MRVLLVDHHIIFREGLAGLLCADPEIEVIGGTGLARDAIEKTIVLQPDVLLLDVDLPDGNGLDVLKTVHAKCPEINIIILAFEMTDELLIAAVENGARGYLLKNIPTLQLIEAIKAVQRNETAFSRSTTRRIIDGLANKNRKEEQSQGLDQLTDREWEVLDQICKGASNLEIAGNLNIAENTVKAHVRKILDKLKLQNRREARRLALKMGFTGLTHQAVVKNTR